MGQTQTQEKNKIEFGLENVHWAPITKIDATGVTYGTPQPLPGAVELTLEPKGDLMEFEADNITYYATQTNQGYEGTLKIALLTDEFRKTALGESQDSNSKAMYELATSLSSPFALMFQFRGDKKNVRHVMHNCVANRAPVGSKTKGNGEPNTVDLKLRAMPRPNDDLVKARTHETTPKETYDNWFKTVFVPSLG